MIIIEGMDLIGKTTLCLKLVEELKKLGFPMEYQHMSKPPADFDFFWGYQRLIKRFVVQDRFHLGELAYGSCIYGCRQTKAQLEFIEAEIQINGGLVVLITATNDWIDRNVTELQHSMKGRDEMFLWPQILDVNRYFRDKMQHFWSPKIDIHYSMLPEYEYRPSDSPYLVKDIIKAWTEKQACLDNILQRRT